MDGFELHMGKRGPDEWWMGLAIMNVGFEGTHAAEDFAGRWRHKPRIAGPGATDPVLRAAELAGRLASAAARGEQLVVHFADEAETEWKALGQAVEAMRHRRDIVRDFANVVVGRGQSRFLIFEQ